MLLLVDCTSSSNYIRIRCRLRNDKRDNHNALELAVVQNSVKVADLIRAKRAETWARTDNAVANWLQTIELPQYTDLLLSQGWDDINFISSVGFTEYDLDTLGIKRWTS